MKNQKRIDFIFNRFFLRYQVKFKPLSYTSLDEKSNPPLRPSRSILFLSKLFYFFAIFSFYLKYKQILVYHISVPMMLKKMLT